MRLSVILEWMTRPSNSVRERLHDIRKIVDELEDELDVSEEQARRGKRG